MNTITKILIPLLFIGLFAACKNDKSTTASAKKEVATVSDKSYTVDASASKVMWLGSKPAGTHNGTVNVSSGTVTTKDGNVSGGSFTIDMNTITCLDLEGGSKEGLEAHLKGSETGKEDDFFNVAKYPTAKFDITKVTKLENNPDASHMIFGNLTMKDVTKNVGFRAKVTNAGGTINVVTPEFTINRTDWGIKYGSKSFFDNLKDKFIDDEMKLSVNLVAK
jgi:polyisoprenoid-binding protein YceI